MVSWSKTFLHLRMLYITCRIWIFSSHFWRSFLSQYLFITSIILWCYVKLGRKKKAWIKLRWPANLPYFPCIMFSFAHKKYICFIECCLNVVTKKECCLNVFFLFDNVGINNYNLTHSCCAFPLNWLM